MTGPSNDLLSYRLRGAIQVLGFVRKELMDILRQPRLLLVLVGGPFLILTLFAAGYDQESVVLRTVFVGPADSVYEDAIERYDDQLGAYIDSLGFTSDVVQAGELVEQGDADLAVIFPPDPVETILDGEQAVIKVIHDKLDPLQQTAVEISAQVAVFELNATVLEQVFTAGRSQAASVDEQVGTVVSLVDRLRAAADATDPDDLAAVTEEIRRSVSGAGTVLDLSEDAIAELDGELTEDETVSVAELRASLAELEEGLDDVESASSPAAVDAAIDRFSRQVDDIEPLADAVLTIDPRVAIRPFVSDSENLLRDAVSVVEFFVPSSLGLLLQHLAITFAAMALVSDSAVGLFESFRVAPLGARHVLVGKYAAYLVIGAAIATVLLAAVIAGVGVPMRGGYGWLAGGVGLLLLASIGLGLVLSVVSTSSTQAVQYAMLTLLVGMFFGGFLITLDAFRMPFRLVSYALPVTYAIRWLQSVMLRGTAPDSADVIGLVVATLAYGALAGVLFSRRLRIT